MEDELVKCYRSSVTEEPKFVKVINSYVFGEHPYFNGPFQSGQLAITQKKYTGEIWNGNIVADVKLWFEFDNLNDAKKSFKQFVDTFTSFNTFRRLTSEQGIKRAEFTDKASDTYMDRVQIVLVTDYTIRNKTAYLTKRGDVKVIYENGYKILVEVGNDLNPKRPHMERTK